MATLATDSVNNAGMMSKCDQSVYTLTEAGLDKEMDVNVKAPLFLSRLAIPHLKETKGCIVNVSSIYSKEITNDCIGYHMTKAATDMMTKVLAKELVTYGVRVNSIK
ncbi:uncharacterized protein LOC110456154 [Mizuhopecten yessoensis]|uniref:uncharacterized protein LOC110456154 n=1 Tax=Mizuhopecten yessoensis TaxID=6573 RepID=UPI000B4578A7|nr:uncharacterized protein LOC110456154 [Mizuhopecten yessoensis]